MYVTYRPNGLSFPFMHEVQKSFKSYQITHFH